MFDHRCLGRVGLFLEPEREVLVARDGGEVTDYVRTLMPERARAIS